jgi:uncharacterized membrane protein
MMLTISHGVPTDIRSVIVAEAGERPNNTTTMEKNTRPLTQEQRKEFVQLLKDAKSRILENLSDSRWKRLDKARKIARQSLFERIGAAELVKKVEDAKKIAKDSEQALVKLGIVFTSSGAIDLTGANADQYSTEIEEKAFDIIEAQKEESRKLYERAILNVLSTESVEDAKALVEPLV